MRRVVSALLLLLLAACSQSEPLSLDLRSEAPGMQPVHATLYSNLRDSGRLLIRDKESWAAVWAEMISIGDPRTPPFIDFENEDVIVAALGERRAGGYAIAIVGARIDDSSTHIVVNTTAPGPTCDRAEIVTAPVAAVRIRKITGSLTFDERATTRDCA